MANDLTSLINALDKQTKSNVDLAASINKMIGSSKGGLSGGEKLAAGGAFVLLNEKLGKLLEINTEMLDKLTGQAKGFDKVAKNSDTSLKNDNKQLDLFKKDSKEDEKRDKEQTSFLKKIASTKFGAGLTRGLETGMRAPGKMMGAVGAGIGKVAGFATAAAPYALGGAALGTLGYAAATAGDPRNIKKQVQATGKARDQGSFLISGGDPEEYRKREGEMKKKELELAEKQYQQDLKEYQETGKLGKMGAVSSYEAIKAQQDKVKQLKEESKEIEKSQEEMKTGAWANFRKGVVEGIDKLKKGAEEAYEGAKDAVVKGAEMFAAPMGAAGAVKEDGGKQGGGAAPAAPAGAVKEDGGEQKPKNRYERIKANQQRERERMAEKQKNQGGGAAPAAAPAAAPGPKPGDKGPMQQAGPSDEEMYERAGYLASMMGKKDFDGFDTSGGVITKIDGIPVPPEYYTDDEKRRLAAAQDVKAQMPSYEGGTLGEDGSLFTDFGKGTVATLHGEEAVIPKQSMIGKLLTSMGLGTSQMKMEAAAGDIMKMDPQQFESMSHEDKVKYAENMAGVAENLGNQMIDSVGQFMNVAEEFDRKMAAGKGQYSLQAALEQGMTEEQYKAQKAESEQRLSSGFYDEARAQMESSKESIVSDMETYRAELEKAKADENYKMKNIQPIVSSNPQTNISNQNLSVKSKSYRDITGAAKSDLDAAYR